MQARLFGAQVPGVFASQPCPSHTPDAHAALSKHGLPSASGVDEDDAGPLGPCVIGGGASIGVAVSPAGGGGGGAVCVVDDGPLRGVQPIRNTAISNSRIFMRASYTPRHG